MSENKKTLNKGLDALLGESNQNQRSVKEVELEKIISRTTRYKAHDAENHCKVGDRVRIKESPPMSAHKRWTVTDVLVQGMKSKEASK